MGLILVVVVLPANCCPCFHFSVALEARDWLLETIC